MGEIEHRDAAAHHSNRGAGPHPSLGDTCTSCAPRILPTRQGEATLRGKRAGPRRSRGRRCRRRAPRGTSRRCSRRSQARCPSCARRRRRRGRGRRPASTTPSRSVSTQSGAASASASAPEVSPASGSPGDSSAGQALKRTPHTHERNHTGRCAFIKSLTVHTSMSSHPRPCQSAAQSLGAPCDVGWKQCVLSESHATNPGGMHPTSGPGHAGRMICVASSGEAQAMMTT